MTAAERELQLVRRALVAGLATHESLAAHCRVGRSTMSCWLSGHRAAPAGLLMGLLDHLTPVERGVVLGWLAEELGAGSVVSLVEARAATELQRAALAYVDATSMRRAA